MIIAPKVSLVQKLGEDIELSRRPCFPEDGLEICFDQSLELHVVDKFGGVILEALKITLDSVVGVVVEIYGRGLDCCVRAISLVVVYPPQQRLMHTWLTDTDTPAHITSRLT